MKNKNSADYKNWIKLIEEEHYKCIRCGECRTICPVYRESSAERYTARGKLAMIKALSEGKLEFNGAVREAIENCLLCSGCASQCSSEVRADAVIAATRRVFAEELGLSPLKKTIGATLSQPNWALGAEASLGSLLQPLLFKKVPKSSGLYRRFAMPFIDYRQYIPKIKSTPLRKKMPFSGKEGQSKVQFFTGCMINYAMTEIGENMVKVMNKLGYAVELPGKQSCCGMPMLAAGDSKHIKKQALKNIKAFNAESDSETPILVCCASCGHMLKHGYTDALRGEEDIRKALENISKRTMDISEFLVHKVGLDKIEAKLKKDRPATPVSYHDPCHLKKAQKISKEPRQILNLATKNQLKELRDPSACCGLGGTYFLSHRELAQDIQKKKQDDAIAVGGYTLTSGCPGCIFQLRDGVGRSEMPEREVVHIIDILADAME